ncbi:NADP-dependent phosphogluconate dehydrogenase [Roseivirga sp. BDSF3-8]|uniref:NADP-dependent phosphogluconate dehydrogenase n=1 Tax=Roseivirga sp. BDSF3-8 TaxID=3241598 RepID=UPI003531D972
MGENTYRFGMVGLGVMGRNFLLNIADNDFSAIGLDNDPEKANALEQEASSGHRIKGVTSSEVFVRLLETPRTIMLLVPAGKIVDDVIEGLIPYLDKGDLIIDGGNSHFSDTERREKSLREKGLHFLGIGVSGGAEGARRGPSIMPGGSRDAYPRVKSILEAVAAKVDGEPCVSYLGPKASGHYVKMVHNGIEYAMMQLISEAYDLLHRGAGLSVDELAAVFKGYNERKLKSFLVEITASIFTKKDDLDEEIYLIDRILDKGKQKGTGKWTSQHALDLGIPIPTIDAAVTMRQLSALREDREMAADLADRPKLEETRADKAIMINAVEDALFFGFIASYSQGMALLQAAGSEMNLGMNLEVVAKIWRGGCIIRAAMLEDIMKAYRKDPGLSNLMMDPHLSNEMERCASAAREMIMFGTRRGIPLAGLTSAMWYFDAFHTSRLPMSLVQAQRDYFGAHTFERTDRSGTFHAEWY